MSRSPEYDALVEKVDAFARKVAARRPDDLECRAGCSSCCAPGLTVSPVEAAPIRDFLARRRSEGARPGLGGAAPGSRPPAGACVFLDSRGECGIYPVRPLVCRTQGLPLLYPADTVPLEAVMARAGTGEVTWCPLNFTQSAPDGDDVLDAGRLDEMLALVNRRFVDGEDEALERIALEDLAREPQ